MFATIATVPVLPSRAEPRRRPARPPAALAALSTLAQRQRPFRLAHEETMPVLPPLGELVGSTGLRRGSTLVVGAACPSGGATALALALAAAASAGGAWCAAVDLPGLGLAAADEMGIVLDRLVLVPDPGRHYATVLGALLGACDVVIAGAPSRLEPALARRLAARAREQRAVLIVTSGLAGGEAAEAAGAAAPSRVARGSWPERPDVRLEITSGEWVGLGDGCGNLRARRVEVVADRRRCSPPRARAALWLPSEDGTVIAAVPAGATGEGPVAALAR